MANNSSHKSVLKTKLDNVYGRIYHSSLYTSFKILHIHFTYFICPTKKTWVVGQLEKKHGFGNFCKVALLRTVTF